MNRQLVRLFGVIAAGFVLLLGFTTYWQLWASSSLAARQDNLHEVVPRAVDRSRAHPRGERRRCSRRACRARRPTGGASTCAAIRTARSSRTSTGYSSPTANRSGLEESQNDYLTGSNSDLSGVLAREFHSITGGTVKGNDVVTSLDPAVQAAAFNGLKATGLPGRRRRARAVDRQGARARLVAELQPERRRARHAAWLRTLKSPGAPLLDRVTQGRYPPGSTFKVITAAAALASGKFTPTSRFVDTGTFTEYGQRDPQRQRRAVRADRPVERADALDQHGLRADRLGALPAATPVRCCRTRCRASACTARRRSTCRRTRSSRRASPTPTIRAGCCRATASSTRRARRSASTR